MKSRTMSILALAVLAIAALSACKPAEEEGTVEQHLEEAGQHAEAAAEEVAKAAEGAMEQAGEALEEAGQAAAEGMKEAVAETEQAMGTAAAALDDAGITAKIKAKLLADPEVAGLKIDVDTKDGVVTLKGTAGSEALKAEAGELARSTEGVKDVKNEITVPPGH